MILVQIRSKRSYLKHWTWYVKISYKRLMKAPRTKSPWRWLRNSDIIKVMKDNNHKVSDEVHYGIPVRVREIVNGHLLINERLKCQHNREILDEIIEDLIKYQQTLPSVQDLEACNVL